MTTVTLSRADVVEPSSGLAFPPPGVRCVVFDVVGTLVEPHPPVAAAYRQVGMRHGIERDLAGLRRGFSAAWRRQEQIDAAATPAFATSPRRERERWRAIVGDVFADDPRCDAIFADLWDHFARPDAWRPLAAGEALVQAAQAAGATVALASNFDERLLGLAGVLEPLTAARHVFASSEIGWRKPACEFFRAVETRLCHGAGELLLVGDDLELDVAAARRAGWRARAVS